MYQVNALSTHPPTQHRTLCLALSPKAKLDWISITDVGNLVTMDSKFVIRLFLSTGIWFPIFDGESQLKNPDDDSIWPIAVREMPTTQVRYIYCKGSRYPKIAKHLALAIDAWSLPMCNEVK